MRHNWRAALVPSCAGEQMVQKDESIPTYRSDHRSRDPTAFASCSSCKYDTKPNHQAVRTKKSEKGQSFVSFNKTLKSNEID